MLAAAGPKPAQAQPPKDAPLDSAQVAADTAGAKPLKLLALPVLGYAPQTRLFLGAAAAATLNFTREARATSASLVARYTLNRQAQANLVWKLFLPEERYFTRGKLSGSFWPEKFWGIGPATPAENEESFDTWRWEVDLNMLRNLLPGWQLFLGPRFRAQGLTALKPAPGGLLARGGVPGSGGYWVYGLGYQLRWDRRSNTLYPKRGFFLDFSQLFFAPEWGSDYRFTRYELELRKYWRPRWDPCGVIAAQFYSEMHTGTPPFRLTGLMGSSSHMRGYYQGRYRDRQYLAAQVEYRRPIFWRIEAAAFAGGGAVAPTLAALSPADLKPTYGAGLRFRFDQQNHGNIRLDYARGARGVSGFYASYGAAF